MIPYILSINHHHYHQHLLLFLVLLLVLLVLFIIIMTAMSGGEAYDTQSGWNVTHLAPPGSEDNTVCMVWYGMVWYGMVWYSSLL